MDYYVSQDGNDDNEGVISSPWVSTRRVAHAFSAGLLSPGDGVSFRRGESWYITESSERIRLAGSSGALGAKITISAYGEGAKPVLHGAPGLYVFGRNRDDPPANYINIVDLNICDVGGQAALRLHDCKGIGLYDLHIHDITTEGGSWCCAVQSRHNLFDMTDENALVAQNIVIEDVQGEGFYIGLGYGLEGPEASLADHSRLLLYSGRVARTRNNAVDVKGGTGSLISGIRVERGGSIVEGQSVCLGGQSHIVRDCHFLGGRIGVAQGTYLAEAWSGYHHLVERCLFSGLTQEAIRLGGGDNVTRNCTFAGCTIGVRVIQAREPHIVEKSIFYDVDTHFVFGAPGHDTRTVRRDNVVATAADFENEETFDLNSNSPLVGLGWRPNPDGGTIMSVIENLRTMATRLRAEADALEAEADALVVIDTAAQAAVIEAQEALVAVQAVEEAL